MKQAKGSLSFSEFYPIFRDSITGLCYIHNKNIAHRDIKPANIMKINKNHYALADYGEGINLSYNCIYLKPINFQKVKF